jgi:hypothetical protein
MAAGKAERSVRADAHHPAEKSPPVDPRPPHPVPGAAQSGARGAHAVPGDAAQHHERADEHGLARGQEGSRHSRAERGKHHREELKRRWGATLAQAPVREELAHHARRMAFLKRALELTHDGAKSKDTAKVRARVEKLIELEYARHERAMSRFAPPSAVAGEQPLPSKGAE